MSQGRTQRVTKASSLPVRSIRVVVVEGADAGSAAHRPERLSIGTAEGNDLVLSDDSVSGFHVELCVDDEGIEVRDHASTNGTWAGQVRLQRAVLRPGTELTIGRTRVRVEEGDGGEIDLDSESSFEGLLGRSRAMRRLVARVKKVAATDAATLIVGESGTGKELIAHALHRGSDRRDGPFITVDCGAITSTLVASELFGHKRGAFTGAISDQKGAFERAEGGTIFLDEVGELSESLQTTLLGVLERRRYRPVGGTERPVDVRVVAATHRELREDVNRGRFRLDLYYRLAVVTLRSPPLRERLDDLVVLTDHFLDALGSERRAAELFGASVLRELEAHTWPGNVRELRNVVEASLALGEPILPTTMPNAGTEDLTGLKYGEAKKRALADFESRYLQQLIAATDGNLSEAARRASMDRAHLRTLLKRHGLR